MNPPYAPYAGINRPMMSGSVPVPKNDDEAMSLVRRSKAALDFHAAQNKGAHPAVQQAFIADRQKHVDTVANAIHAYHKATPSDMSTKLVNAMHADPNIKITAPKPPM